ncbi:MAG: 30S ribosomal protein S6 [Eubacteriales bacterium]|nr:30S ribosomal protein S6 [Eubacteriales bacterium]
MEKKINSYETMFIVDAQLSEEATQAIVEKFKTLIEKHATITKLDEWGKRRLAYPINDQNEGYYVLVNFEADGAFIAELDRIFNITDGIIRSMTVRV